MGVIRELLHLEESSQLGMGNSECGIPHLSFRSPNWAEVNRLIDGGAMAKAYVGNVEGRTTKFDVRTSEFALRTSPAFPAIKGICVLVQDPECTGRDAASGQHSFSISALTAEGEDREQVEIKTGLVQEMLTEISGVRGRVSIDLPSSDQTGVSALKRCGFHASAPGLLSAAEQAWEELLQSAGCTLMSDAAGGREEASGLRPTALCLVADAKCPEPRFVTFVKEIGGKDTTDGH